MEYFLSAIHTDKISEVYTNQNLAQVNWALGPIKLPPKSREIIQFRKNHVITAELESSKLEMKDKIEREEEEEEQVASATAISTSLFTATLKSTLFSFRFVQFV